MTMLSFRSPHSHPASESTHLMNRTNLHLKVLVVDSVQSMAQALTVILIEHGYDASPAYGSAEALVSCRLNRPDVVVIGVLPQPDDGVQLAKQILNDHSTCKVLRISDGEFALKHDALKRDKDPRSTHLGSPIRSKPVNSRAILDFLDAL